MNGPYDDIIRLPRPVSVRHTPMPIANRAAQFAPFAALTGYEAAIDETARLTEEKIELSDEERAALNQTLQALLENQSQHPQVTVTHFQPDRYKSGGSYQTSHSALKKVDPDGRRLLLTDGTVIDFENICALIHHRS